MAQILTKWTDVVLIEISRMCREVAVQKIKIE